MQSTTGHLGRIVISQRACLNFQESCWGANRQVPSNLGDGWVNAGNRIQVSINRETESDWLHTADLLFLGFAFRYVVWRFI